MKNLVSLILILFTIVSCKQERQPEPVPKVTAEAFYPSSLTLKDTDTTEQLTGQVLYLPVYSNIPQQIDAQNFDMSAFVAVHNTDFKTPITISRALYFNGAGLPVHDFLVNGSVMINPLATYDFKIPYEDTSGLGANFIIEWISDSPVNIPLIESVTISLKPNQSVAVLSTGRVVRKRR